MDVIYESKTPAMSFVPVAQNQRAPQLGSLKYLAQVVAPPISPSAAALIDHNASATTRHVVLWIRVAVV